MSGTHSSRPVFSRITLALMEDTGWYKANYDMASDLTWGKNLGCDFVMKSCKSWISSHHNKWETEFEVHKNIKILIGFIPRGRSIHPFCSKIKRDPLQTECTDDRNSVALCNLVKHDDPLPQEYQNFDTLTHVHEDLEYYGGSVSLGKWSQWVFFRPGIKFNWNFEQFLKLWEF